MNKKLRAYLNSRDWLRRSTVFKEKKKYTCELCNNHILLEVVEIFYNKDHHSWKNPEIRRFAEWMIEANGNKNRLIQAHHRTYDHMGCESFSEIAVLCKPCHTYYHENTSGVEKSEAWNITAEKVKNICESINNQPDGKKEFSFIDPGIGHYMLLLHGLEEPGYLEYRSERDFELDELRDDYFDFVSDYYDNVGDFN